PRPPRPPLFPSTTLFRSNELLHLPDKPAGVAQNAFPHNPGRSEFSVSRSGICPRSAIECHRLGGCSSLGDTMTEVTQLLNAIDRSEEHTSELQSPYDIVC